MGLPALRLAFVRGLATDALGELLLGTVLVLPPDLPEAEREEICDLCALFAGRPVHVAATPAGLPEGHVCVVTEPVDRPPDPVKDGVVLAVGALDAGRRRLGLPNELRRLRDVVLTAVAARTGGERLDDIALWAQEVADSPSTALRFASAAEREILARPRSADTALVAEGLAETIGWLLRGVDARVAEWVLARAVPSKAPARLVSMEAALLGETAALQRALAAGLVEHLPERPDDPDDMLYLRRPIALLGRLGDLTAPVDLPMVAAALRPRLDPAVYRVFDRLFLDRPKPLRLGPPSLPRELLGRDEVVARLSVLFEPSREIRTAVVHGMSGLGKTAVAAAVCERLSDRLEPVWLTFAGGPEAAWRRVADALGIDTQGRNDARTPAGTPMWLGRVYAAMAERDALVVADDVDTVLESELPAWLPGGAGTCAVLVLSRQSQRVLQRERDAIVVALRPLNDAEARELLSSKAPALAEAIRRGDADTLLHRLGGHPAAVRVAAGLLEKRSLDEVAGLVRRDEAIHGLVKPALEALDAEERKVVEALAVAAPSGSPHALVARMVGVEDVEPVLRRLTDRALVEMGPHMVRLLGIVQLGAEMEMEERRRRELEVEHAAAVDKVMEAAWAGKDEEGRDEAYADAMLAIGRMTERCQGGEGELAGLAYGLAGQFVDYRRGRLAETLAAVIAGVRAALGVWTRESERERWAGAQNILGNALMGMPLGDRAGNVQQAITAYEAALSVYTRDKSPKGWARAQSNLGNAYQSLPTGNRLGNIRLAIEACEAALTVYTESTDPKDWANVQNNLGNALSDLPDGNRSENQHRAIQAYEVALRIYTVETYPEQWAMVQNNLASVLAQVSDGDRTENLQRAVEALRAALTVYTPRNDPERWAGSQINIGVALVLLRDGDRETNLRRGIEAFQAALTVCTRDAFPWDWARAQQGLGHALSQLPGGDRRQLLRAAVDAFQRALTIYTEEAFPAKHAAAQAALDDALRELAALGPATDRPPAPAAS